MQAVLIACCAPGIRATNHLAVAIPTGPWQQRLLLHGTLPCPSLPCCATKVRFMSTDGQGPAPGATKPHRAVLTLTSVSRTAAQQLSPDKQHHSTHSNLCAQHVCTYLQILQLGAGSVHQASWEAPKPKETQANRHMGAVQSHCRHLQAYHTSILQALQGTLPKPGAHGWHSLLPNKLETTSLLLSDSGQAASR
jgi:hypothetical protein